MLSIGGHLLVISSFVFPYPFLLLSTLKKNNYNPDWLSFGRYSYFLHLISILELFLVYIFFADDDFRYYYAFQHTSTTLPIYFKISSFWEVKRSFLLWMFWNVLIGLYFCLRPPAKWNVSIMVVIGFTQLILSSMILVSVFRY